MYSEKKVLSSLLTCYSCGDLGDTASTTASSTASPPESLPSSPVVELYQQQQQQQQQQLLASTMMRARSEERRHSHTEGSEIIINAATAATTVVGIEPEGRFEDSERRENNSSAMVRNSMHRRAISEACGASQEQYRNGNGQRRHNKVEEVVNFTSVEDEFADAMEEDVGEAVSPNSKVIATLPKFSSQSSKNCWSEPPVTIYHVRGGKYFKDKKKINSGPYLLPARGCDLFISDNSKKPVDLQPRLHSILGGELRSKPTMAINFRFPWGYMNLYHEIPKKLVPYLNSNSAPAMDQRLSPSEKCMAGWFLGDEEYRNERLKLIAYVAEGPWVVRNMVTGKPVLIGQKLPVTYELNYSNGPEAPLLTANLDIGSSSTTAKRIVSVCRRYMSALTVDIGFVIQAEAENELPEQMLGSIRIHGVDPMKAPKLS